MAGVLTRIVDAFRTPSQSAPPRSMRRLGDSIVNPITGMGGTMDPTAFNRFFNRHLSQWEIEQAYSGSWVMRKLIDKPAKDMVRPRRRWKADKPTIALLEKEEKRLRLWEKLKLAEIERGRGGGAIVIWVEGDDPTTPLDPKRIKAAGLASLSVWSRWDFVLGPKVFNLASPWHGQPEYFEIASLQLITQQLGIQRTAALRLHPSRVVCFRAEDVPQFGVYDWPQEFWGASTVEVALNAVLNCEAAQSGFASMVKDAVNVIIGIPGLTDAGTTAEIQQIQQERMAQVNASRSIWRAIIKDAGKGGKDAEGAETIEYRQMNWAGIPDTLMVFMYPVAAAGNMPATVLLGKSPDGMNATGNGDLTNWRDEIDSRRENNLRPGLEQIDVALVPSALGKSDDGIWFEYGPLAVPSDKEKADTAYAKAQAVQIYVNLGVLNQQAAEKAIANTIIEDGLLIGFDDALDEIPEDERYPALGAPDPNEPDPSAMQAGDPANPAKGGDPSLAGGGASQRPASRAVNDARFMDAAPKTLYVQRKLLNAAEFIRWAKGQGFETTTPAGELHVTVAFSRQPVDWMTIGQDWSSDKDGNLTVPAGGARIVQALGDKGAVVLLFASNDLTWRHKSILEAGASFDFDQYQPHITISYNAPADLDLAKVEPYTGPLKLGPELFSTIDDDWQTSIDEE